MTKLNAVNIGMNKYCGPAVLSILTGKSTDECARVISSINGQYRVEGVQLTDLLKAADKLGFTNQPKDGGSSLYTTLVKLVNDDGMYIVTVPNHFVAIEVNEKKIYFCDNHTKEPMPAASSARMLQRVLAVHKVFKKPDPVVIRTEIRAEVYVYRKVYYNNPELDSTRLIESKCFTDTEDFNRYVDGLKLEVK